MEYVEERWEELSEIEAGTLYGYPATSTLAFSRVLTQRTRRPETAAAFYLGGIYSEEYFDEEKAYIDNLWRIVRSTSPLVAAEAKSHYCAILKNTTILKKKSSGC